MCHNILVKRVPFKKSPSPLSRKKGLAKRSKLRQKGRSESSQAKERIQVLLRAIGLVRDGGCIFRHYPETGDCGGYRKDGELILQFDHLNSRVHAVSFSDSRLGVIACLRHHFYYKKQYPFEYERCAIDNIGEKRAQILFLARHDRSPHKNDLKLAEIALTAELTRLQEKGGV